VAPLRIKSQMESLKPAEISSTLTVHESLSAIGGMTDASIALTFVIFTITHPQNILCGSWKRHNFKPQ